MPFAILIFVVSGFWALYLRLAPVGIVDAMIDGSMSVNSIYPWSEWTVTAKSAGLSNYRRTITVERSFHTVRLTQTADGTNGVYELSIPNGGGQIKPVPTIAVTVLGLIVAFVCARIYGRLLRKVV